MRTKSIVVFAAALLLVASVAPAVATDGSLAVSVEQHDDGSATAAVTHNSTAVENASVEVSTAGENASYAGEGNYTTDANGTVDLPAPTENVTIEVLAAYDDETANTTAELVVASGNETAGNESFGGRVSWFVHQLLDGWEDKRGIGQVVATFVVENNPGNAPDHAGPPNATVSGNGHGQGSGGNHTATTGHGGERGPPDHAGSNDRGKGKGNGK